MAMLACAVFCAAIACSAVATPLPGKEPVLALSWSARVEGYRFTPDNRFSGRWYMDLTAEKPRWRQIEEIAFHPLLPTGEVMQETLFVNGTQNVTYGNGADAFCAVGATSAAPPMENVFVLLAFGTNKTWMRNGSSVVQGDPCDVWHVSLMSGRTPISAYMCVAKDGVPRELTLPGYTSLFFSGVRVKHMDDTFFEPTAACLSYPAPACPVASPAVADMTLYRLHSHGEPRLLPERNFGDVAGAPVFIQLGAAGLTDPNERLTLWRISMSTAYGQYGRCHFNGTNYCDGQTGKQVGRQSPMGLGAGAFQGQCATNDDIGSWFSFPTAGECKNDAVVGTDGCTYSGKRVRTIATTCLVEQGLLKAFDANDRQQASQVLELALASANPLMGGCPDVDVNESASATVLV